MIKLSKHWKNVGLDIWNEFLIAAACPISFQITFFSFSFSPLLFLDMCIISMRSDDSFGKIAKKKKIMCNGLNMAWLIACGHAQAKRENNITIIMDLCARALKWYRILPVRLMPYNYLMAIVRMCQCKGTVNEYYRKHLLHSYLKRLEIMFELVCAMYDCMSTHWRLLSPSPSLTPSLRRLAGL